MSIKLLDAQELSVLLPQMFEIHDEIYVIAAWGSNGPVADSLFKQVHKFRSVTFGLAFCQTDPDLVDRMVDVTNGFVALSDKGTFHPKLYYFSSGTEAEAVVGSSNFTKGGLETNLEANIHIKGPRNARIFKEIRNNIKGFSEYQQPVTKELSAIYRLQYEAAKKQVNPASPVLSGSDSMNQAISIIDSQYELGELRQKGEGGAF